MALPAGYSSDEEFSDDDLSLGHDFEKPKKVYVLPKEEEDSAGDKFISAVIKDDINEVEKLINKEVVNYQSKKYGCWSALMHACSRGHVEMVELLLKNKADPKEHFQLMTPLHCVCDSSCADELALLNCISLLLDRGANLNAKDWYSLSPLSFAVKRNKEKVVLKLLSLGCDVDSEDTDGWTAIFYAVDGGHTNLVQILKDAGASLYRIDHKGRSLYDIASAKFYKGIAEMVNTSDKLVDVDDIIDKFRNYRRMSNYEYILSELPDKKKGRFFGFQSDAARWIHGIGLETLVKLFIDKEIQLGQILTMDDKELKEIGVTFSYDRIKIRYCVQNFHQHSWGKNCLREIKKDLDLNFAAQMMCNVLKQMHIVSTSTYFWKKHGGHELCRNRECINQGLYYIKFLRKEIDGIQKILREIEEENDIKPCDLILPQQKIATSWLGKKTIIFTMVLIAVSFKSRKYLYQSIGLNLPFKIKILS
ncbi:ankyrin repeat, SAM and basic leucine zipper domain-containing protein 1 [Halyomorpha halys]|uniref:ankyrin repeat, SAM and basic leucine zipper domain-containing protein 1 n=1 Tax=Halyomorpha halys TaxID=286706 RepID=UPI0006D4CA57|nr:ankyrin repeat, SAM and basic leucine zipper domain-containing protein 1 [Halyomorpha halys]